MQFTEIYEKTAYAFEHDEVFELLLGVNDYACPVDKYVPANVPTDFGRIITDGIYALYKTHSAPLVVKAYKDAIIALAQGNAIEVWVAFSVCWNQLYYEYRSKEHPAPFKIIDTTIIKCLRQNVLRVQKELSLSKEWQGWNQKEGLWGDIQIQNNKLVNWFGVSLI